MKCAHPHCDCIDPTFPMNGEFYCDSACAVSASDLDDGCGCRHASCTEAGAGPAGAGSDDDAEDAVPQVCVPPGKQAAEPAPTSTVPVTPTSNVRRRHGDLDASSGRGDSSRRPDLPSRPLEVPLRPQPKGRAART